MPKKKSYVDCLIAFIDRQRSCSTDDEKEPAEDSVEGNTLVLDASEINGSTLETSNEISNNTLVL